MVHPLSPDRPGQTESKLGHAGSRSEAAVWSSGQFELQTGESEVCRKLSTVGADLNLVPGGFRTI